MIARLLKTTVLERLRAFPVVALLGPRQCGKSTLAAQLLRGLGRSVYLDLEKPAGRGLLGPRSSDR